MTMFDKVLLPLCAGQKISPDGKAKIQLQLVLHTGESTTFHFSNESTALKDREATKELLQQLLPKFKKKANKELEEKNRWHSEADFQSLPSKDNFGDVMHFSKNTYHMKDQKD